ncbi:D-alanyl-D-alanine carboxypeptidase/D-alanyl-D-alanine-endopeptidase [Streptomyces polygonati]|uniref:D-alanyl-D-alanine carboxypeptidase/D-alanyl-D-alanine-endopeptidase n=1 Tax=Streptomyces polygonati TaxID=1617087 RepID=A0ABV8HNE3_9ACTN
MPLGRTWQVVAGSAAIGLAVAGGTIAAAGPWESGQRTAERSFAVARDRQLEVAARPVPKPAPAPPPAAAPVLLPVPVVAGAASAPGAAPLTARLDRLIAAPGLGTVRTGAVVDVASGQLLYGHHATTVSTPASTTKLATAVAALTTLGPGHRLTTSVVSDAADPGRIVLVGGGDPTLVLDGLADDTARALKAGGTTAVVLAYDTSFFAGPALHPIGPNENLAPVTALMADEGRLDKSGSGPAPRAADPAGAAAAGFAALLAERGITVKGAPRAGSGAGGTPLAVHRSAPLSDLVERMLTDSDNDLAEALARQTARAAGLPANFAGGAKAIRAVLAHDAVPLGGAVFTDGSGLDHADSLAPLTLARILALAASPAHPELRPILTGLPVAAFTGTLSARFHASPGAGVVHAKTGTLTGTNTIAGTTVSRAGRLLAFSFMTQGAGDPAAAQGALDNLASALTE